VVHPAADAMPVLRVDEGRLHADLVALGEIGWEPGHGLARTTFSPAHRAARVWFLERARAADLPTRVDAAANHSAILPGPPGSRTVMLGSHLDSVPGGGRYDGALGVLCALEALRAIKDAGLQLPVSLEAIDFTDEEGTLVGTLGSWALAGTLTAEILARPRSGRERLHSELSRMGLTEDGLRGARRDPRSLAAYVELHVEQGPVLEREGVDIGVVTGIRGNRSFEVTLTGAARHAGTTPLDARRDAGRGAVLVAQAVWDVTAGEFPGCVANVGDIRLEPGAFNVVPGRAHVLLECRADDDDELDRLATRILDRVGLAADECRLEAEIRPVGHWRPAATDADVRAAIRHAAEALGLSVMPMSSGAGHDAQVLAEVVPAGMVFVPSVDGVSHDASEHTRWADCVNGANVLLGAALALAKDRGAA
jgi:beta-ureidopropionase / N-carbamoyl-L-amino-acid hydrolase